ncbi:MAG: SpoIIE family protein phosphatase [Verrucomicrobiota bacterium]
MLNKEQYIIDQSTVTVQQVRVRASLEAVHPVREMFVAYLESVDVSASEIGGWKLVFTELLNNAIIHGSGENDSESIEIEWSLSNRAIQLCIEDPGTGPTKSQEIEATLPENPEQDHGRGRFIIQSFADRVAEWRTTNGFRIEVEKGCRESGGIEPPSEEMEAILKELSASYEGLAAFYQLSESLVKSDTLSILLDQSLRNVRESIVLDYLCIFPMSDLPPFIQTQFRQVAQIIDDVPTPIHGLLQRKCEIVWENPDQQAALDAGVNPIAEFSSGCLLPITSEENFFGLLAAGRRRGSNQIVSSQVNNLRTFADIFGIAIANFISTTIRHEAEKDLREFEIAAEIQQHLLPIRQPIEPMKHEVRVFQRVAQNVAGDYAEYCQDRLGNHYLTIIDVMGKGVSAAMLGILYRAALNLLLSTPKPLPVMLEQIGRVLNFMLGDLTMFITVTILRWNDEVDMIEHVNAGHCPTVKISEDGTIQQFEPSGPPIGLLAEYRYESDTIEMEPGDRVILVSDGCYEWKTNDSIFGWERLIDLIREGNHPHGAQLWHALCQIMDLGPNGEEPADDITLVFLK